jgi:hypothetical protein
MHFTWPAWLEFSHNQSRYFVALGLVRFTQAPSLAQSIVLSLKDGRVPGEPDLRAAREPCLSRVEASSTSGALRTETL